MPCITAQIVRFVDAHQPGWVECEFVDAEGRNHILKDKIPIFTAEMLDVNSKYPIPGLIPCEVLERFKNEKGQELVRVTTERPCAIESAEGVFKFTVHSTLIISTPD
jgi:hypothetical protein